MLSTSTEETVRSAGGSVSLHLYQWSEITLSDYPNRKELERMKTNNDDHKKPAKENLSVIEKYKMTLKRLCCREFLKPFLFLNLILNFGLEWAGFPALAFYMHSVLKQMEIPLDEYWVAVALAGYRSALTVALSFVLYKVATHPHKKGPVMENYTRHLTSFSMVIYQAEHDLWCPINVGWENFAQLQIFQVK